MKQIKIAGFDVRELTTGEAISLFPLMDKEDGRAFGEALLSRCISKGGVAFFDVPASESLPHMGALLEAAMEVNGYKSKADASVGK